MSAVDERSALDHSVSLFDHATSLLKDELASNDPTRTATPVGGAREYAEQLGYPWPDHVAR